LADEESFMTVNWVTEWMRYSEGVIFRIATDGFKYLIAFGGALVVSLLLTPLFREGARKIGMVDKPDARRINKVPIPRGGGLAIFAAFHLMLWMVSWGHKGAISRQFPESWQSHFLAASSVLVVIGLIDDKCGLRPLIKLFGQIAVAAMFYISGVNVGGIMAVAFPPWLDAIVTVVWIVGAVNAFNLIDGMDGVASGLALIASAGLAGALLFTGDSADTLPYLVLAGACLGFLRYNFHPASVFLGDSGSMFLGLCIATLPLMTGTRHELVASLGMPLLVMGVPIFDTMLAIWRRSVRAFLPQGVRDAGNFRVNVMQPDRDHLHHRLLRQTMNQQTAAVVLYGMSVGLVAVGLGGTLLKERAPGLFMIAFVVAVFVVVRHLECVELWDTGRLLSGKRGTLRQGLLIPFYIFVDVSSLCAVWMVARWEFSMPLSRMAIQSEMPRFVVPVFVLLVVMRTYWRVWSRAQIRDFAVLGGAVGIGTAVGAGLVWLFSEETYYVGRFSLLFGTLAVFPISLIRLWRDSVYGVMQVLERKILLNKPETLRLLAYGGGFRFRGYLRELGARPGTNDRVVLGIVDDDVNLRGRIIAGHRVVGGADKIDEVMAKQRVDGVIITCFMDEEKLERMTHWLSGKGLRVSVWVCEEKVQAERRDGDAGRGDADCGNV
jgi:UDP-N-acetylmuramyl pentapeptide phosphotransferase/UDP-N-acetylglucosamine-1-phosphate transferase